MQEYQFIPDLMETWREANDTVKIITIVGLYITINMVVAMVSLGRLWLRYRYSERRRQERQRAAVVQLYKHRDTG
ncbi:MAG: hypothetical protein ACON4J_01230 [Parvibaculales bacterium]